VKPAYAAVPLRATCFTEQTRDSSGDVEDMSCETPFDDTWTIQNHKTWAAMIAATTG
jgi:hypothetical protein